MQEHLYLPLFTFYISKTTLNDQEEIVCLMMKMRKNDEKKIIKFMFLAGFNF